MNLFFLENIKLMILKPCCFWLYYSTRILSEHIFFICPSICLQLLTLPITFDILSRIFRKRFHILCILLRKQFQARSKLVTFTPENSSHVIYTPGLNDCLRVCLPAANFNFVCNFIYQRQCLKYPWKLIMKSLEI